MRAFLWLRRAGAVLAALLGLLTVAAPLTAEQGPGVLRVPSVAGAPGLQSAGSVVAAHRFSCLRHAGSSWTRDRTGVSCTGKWILYC